MRQMCFFKFCKEKKTFAGSTMPTPTHQSFYIFFSIKCNVHSISIKKNLNDVEIAFIDTRELIAEFLYAKIGNL